MSSIPKEEIVIVLETSNYKASYSEQTPFKAKVLDKWDEEVLIESLTTGKEYELYCFQILEYLKLDEIKNLINHEQNT